MKTNIEVSRDVLEKKIMYVKHEMERFFQCEESHIKFSNPLYYDEDKFQVLVRFTLKIMHTHEMTSTSNYYFDFEGEYVRREGLLLDGNFYGYDSLNDFFHAIFNKISHKQNSFRI